MCSQLVQEQQRKYMPCEVNLLRQRNYATWCSSGCKVPQVCTKSKRQTLNDHPSKEKPYDAKPNEHKLSSDQTPDYLIYYILMLGGFNRSTQSYGNPMPLFISWVCRADISTNVQFEVVSKLCYFTSCEEADSSWNYWGKALKISENPGLLYLNIGGEILPQKTGSGPFEIQPTRSQILTKSWAWWMIYLFF